MEKDDGGIMILSDCRAFLVDMKKVLLKVDACKSGEEAMRLIRDGAVEVDGEKVGREAYITDGCVLHVGKRFWCRLRNTDPKPTVVETWEE